MNSPRTITPAIPVVAGARISSRNAPLRRRRVAAVRCGRARVVGLAFVLLAMLGFGQAAMAQEGAAQGPPPAMVRFGQVAQETLQNRREVVGRLQAVRRSVVAAEYGGRIVAVQAEEGAHVSGGGETGAGEAGAGEPEAGEVLAEIDDVWLALERDAREAELAAAKARVEEALAALEISRRDSERLAELAKVHSAQPKEVADARSRLHADEARLMEMRAGVRATEVALARLAEQMQRTKVRAPFSGTVANKLVEVGEWVDEGQGVMEIVSRGAIDAVIDVPESLISLVELGQAVELHIAAVDLSVTGEVVAMLPSAATAARTFPVKVRTDDQDGRLLDGMSVSVMLPTSEEGLFVTVDRDAVLRGPTGNYVWVNADGVALRRDVRVLFGHEARVAVEPLGVGPPLTPSMQVVVEGGERILFPGQPLVPAPVAQ